MLVPRSHLQFGSRALLLAALAAACGCASEEIPKYGDPSRVAGGVGGGGTGQSTGGDGGSAGGTTAPCTVDTGCMVSFKNDIFPIFDGRSKCASAPLCHGPGGDKGGLSLIEGDSDNYYSVLTTHQVSKPAGPYIVACNPAKSQLPCNLSVVPPEVNPQPLCGNKPMPTNAKNGVTLEELQKIKDWITCGAPNN